MLTAIPKTITVRGGANNTSTVKQSRCDYYPNIGIMAEKLDWSVITKHRHFSVGVAYATGLGYAHIVTGALTDAKRYAVKTRQDNVETIRTIPASDVIKTVQLYVATLFRRRKLGVKTPAVAVPQPTMVITPEVI